MRYAAFVFWVMAQVLALVAFAPVHAQMPAPRAAAQAPAAQGPAAQGPAAQAPAAPAKDKPAAKAATETAPTAASAPAAAPPSPDLSRVGETLDKANAALNDIEATLDRHNLNDADLVAARQLIAPIADSVSAAADKVTPRLTEIKARLDQLGAPPDDKSPPESPSVTDERTAQQQSFSNADELLKRAKLLSVRAEQMKTNIAARRRTLFATSLFQRSTSIADASLWRDVWREAPGNIDDVGKLFSDWAARINARFDGLSRLAFWLGLPAILLAYIPFARFSLHLFARSATLERPSSFLKILGAWWVALVIAIPPIALTYLMTYGLDAANLTSLRIQTVFNAVSDDVVRIAVTLGLARGLLAPTRPNWRLPPVSDAAAVGLVRTVVSVAGILLITRFCEALNDVIDASLSFSVVTRGLGALLAAMALALGLWRVGADSTEDADCLGPLVTRRRNWFAVLRGLALAAAVVVVAVLAGYPTFASFFLDQVIWVSGVATVFFMASLLVEEAIGNGFKPTARFGNWLVNRVRPATQFAGATRRRPVRRVAPCIFPRRHRCSAGALGPATGRRSLQSAHSLLWLQGRRRRRLTRLHHRRHRHFWPHLGGGAYAAALARRTPPPPYRARRGAAQFDQHEYRLRRVHTGRRCRLWLSRPQFRQAGNRRRRPFGRHRLRSAVDHQ